MNAHPSYSCLLHRFRISVAVLFGILGFAFLWAGFGISDFFVFQREAIAESSSTDYHDIPLSVISRENAALLQTTVDSAALSLGSIFAASSEVFHESEKYSPALSSALSSLTFGLGGEVYFTAWQGTRIIHSPLAPDAAGMDFADFLDERGTAFVQRMHAVAMDGGGFIQVTLPRQMSVPDRHFSGSPFYMHQNDSSLTQDLDHLVGEIVGTTTHSNENDIEAVVVRGAVEDISHDLAEVVNFMPEYCPLTSTPLECGPMPRRPPSRVDSTPVEQVVYIRQIPRSDWHIAAFMPKDALVSQAMAPLWNLNSAGEAVAESTYRQGLCISGFSMAGLAGLMMVPGRGRRVTFRKETTA